VFLVVLFLLKTRSAFVNEAREDNNASQQGGLTYSSAILGDLVNKDTDGDGVLDWEEGLWGTDPTKKETTPGVPDKVAIEKLKLEQGASEQTNATSTEPENLTQTDKFARDFFSTVATLNQNGAMDQATVDKLSSSLADHIQNTPPRKVYQLSNIKIINDDSFQAIKKYDYALRDIYTKYSISASIPEILQEFAPDENTVNTDALLKLNPIIEQKNKIIESIAKTDVPQSLALLDLDLLNALERVNENLSDLQLYDKDIIIALSATVQYNQNTAALATAANNLTNAIKEKWQN
jgi:hypothetical protein